MRDLKPQDAKVVNDSWEYATKQSLPYIEFQIKNCTSVGILDRNSQLIAFCITHYHGGLGTLYVAPAHRGRGLAKTIVTLWSGKRLKQGFLANCQVVKDNQRAITLYETCGFVIKGNRGWIGFKPKD